MSHAAHPKAQGSSHPLQNISPARWWSSARGSPFSLGTRQALFTWHVFMCCTGRAERGPAPEHAVSE